MEFRSNKFWWEAQRIVMANKKLIRALYLDGKGKQDRTPQEDEELHQLVGDDESDDGEGFV